MRVGLHLPLVRRIAAVAGAAAATFASCGLTSEAWAGGPAVGATYVALGDSYAAGEGLGSFEDGTDVFPEPKSGTNTNKDKNLCHRSTSDAYGSIDRKVPMVLPEVPAANRAFWACSGARSKDMMRAGGQGGLTVGDEYYQHGQPDQTSTVGENTRWISISAGGNDVQFGELIKACAQVNWRGKAKSVPGAPDKSCNDLIGAGRNLLSPSNHILHDRLTTLYTALLDRAPRAVLAAVGYPRVFPSDYDRAQSLNDRSKFCVTNNYGLAKLGFPVKDAQRLDADIIRGLNKLTSDIVRELASDPRYAGRIRYADPYFSDDVVPRNCAGRTPHASVNGLVVSPGGHGLGPGGAISTASFHPTKDGQKVIGQAVQAAFTTVPKPPSPAKVVLGSPNYVNNGEGWGKVAPTVLSNGGAPSGVLANIVWSNWGAPIASGMADAAIYHPAGNYYPAVRVPLVVKDIGTCPGRPGRAYLTFMLRVPPWPGGPLGSWFKWSGSSTTCDYGKTDPAYVYPAPWPGDCGNLGEFDEPGTIQEIQTYELSCDTARAAASVLRQQDEDFHCAQNGCALEVEGLTCEMHALVDREIREYPLERISCARGDSTMSAWFVRYWD